MTTEPTEKPGHGAGPTPEKPSAEKPVASAPPASEPPQPGAPPATPRPAPAPRPTTVGAGHGAPAAPGAPAARVHRSPPPAPKAKSIPNPAMETLVKEVYGAFNAEISYAVDEVSVLFPRDQIAKACDVAKTDQRLQMNYLRCLVVTEYPEFFQVATLVYSTTLKHKFILKVNAPKDDPVVPSVTNVWSGANWHEREGAELYGVKFAGHPDPRFLLLFEEFTGKYPLRKDYPYEEITEWTLENAPAWQEQP